MPSFSISLSGLLANEEALSVISNNLANLSTVGYKGSRPEFADLLSQQLGSAGSGNPIQLGLGTKVDATSIQFIQGNIQSTGVPTDVAIQGDGFFQVQKGGLALYTRDGNFSINAQGFLVTQDGSQVMGYPAVNGVVTPSGALSPLLINSGQNNAPKPTSSVQIGMNLDAGTAVGGTFSTSVAVFDSLGKSHVLTYNFTKTATNAWSYQITIPAVDVGGLPTAPPVVINSGNLTFNGLGNLTAPAGDVTGINIAGLADGANNLTYTWKLYDANANSVIKQVAGTSAASSTQQDGYASGALVSFRVGPDGTIQGSFTNGQTSSLGQIALAVFPNSQGLLRTGDNNFLASLASGLPTVGVPGTGGRGTITGGGLESSNVDIATEFAQLILAQRGYQANARAFTATDQITQEALNLTR